jgi:hypothetical protein
LRRFAEENRVKVLNVAGPRASKKPDVGEFVMAALDAVFGQKEEGEIRLRRRLDGGESLVSRESVELVNRRRLVRAE